MVETELTPAEKQLVDIVRTTKIEFGRIELVIYWQHGRLVRVEIVKVIESKPISN
jgi:hypothetical protein